MRILVFCLLLITLAAAGQSPYKQFGVKEGLFTYERTEQLDSVKALQIFTKSKEYLIETFRSVDPPGESSPTLLTKQITIHKDNGFANPSDFYADLTIKIKDGAMRVTVTKFLIYFPDSDPKAKPLTLEGQVVDPAKAVTKEKKVYLGLEEACNQLVLELMKRVKSKDDW